MDTINKFSCTNTIGKEMQILNQKNYNTKGHLAVGITE